MDPVVRVVAKGTNRQLMYKLGEEDVILSRLKFG
jgi:hypothetical protein